MAQNDLVILERLGDRLISAFARLISALPAQARGISGMSRYLGVHKATCQRLVEGVTKSDQGLSAFVRLPGVDALRALLKACRKKGADAARVEACEAAVERWDAELRRRGVSQRGLVEMIASLRTGKDAPASDLTERRAMEHRRALYGAARRLTGEDVAIKIGIGMIEPLPGGGMGAGSPATARRFRVTAVAALLGVRRESFARPIAPFVIAGSHDALPIVRSSVAQPAREPTRFQLLSEFSTAGLHAVRLAETEARTLLVIDTDGTPEGESVDVAVLFTTETTLPKGVRISAAARVVQPTQLLVNDVYVDASLARDAHPVAGCFALTATPGDRPGGGPDECWHDRFPETVRPVMVRPAERSVGKAARAEAVANQLAVRMFEMRGAAAAGFRGWRTLVRYPVWQSEYRTYV